MLCFEEWRQHVKIELPKQLSKTDTHYTAFWDKFIVHLHSENSIAYLRVKASD